jgi:hypothetical protein
MTWEQARGPTPSKGKGYKESRCSIGLLRIIKIDLPIAILAWNVKFNLKQLSSFWGGTCGHTDKRARSNHSVWVTYNKLFIKILFEGTTANSPCPVCNWEASHFLLSLSPKMLTSYVNEQSLIKTFCKLCKDAVGALLHNNNTAVYEKRWLPIICTT